MSSFFERGNKRLFLLIPWFFLAVVNTASAGDGYAWLKKIDDATHNLSYEGIFVYQHNHSLEAVRILHSVGKDGIVRERLLSLTGAPREIVRDRGQVLCYLPDQKSLVIEHRASGKGFPSILPDRVAGLKKHYEIEMGGTGRVAGHPAQQIMIRPRDKYRYGYQLWADKASGLLLKAVLVNSKGKPIEQFMFTQLDMRSDISPKDLELQEGALPSGVFRDEGRVRSGEKPRWTATELPPGFELASHLTRTTPAGNAAVEHLVYSDGLASVSVFVEKLGPESAKGFRERPGRMGAVHAFGKRVNDHQVMVVGEVPAATVNLIGESVKPLE